ncbi:MAG: bile acid:sodium symporter family protein [Cyanobacteriota bacterium]
MQKFFLPLVLIFMSIALYFPPAFTWGKPYIALFLGLVMFGMGATLTTKDFVNVSKNWKAVIVGVVANYTVMPLVACILGLAFFLDKNLFVGIVLVGCCPSGTASNVMTFIGKGNVALSVTMTMISTIVAPVATPAIFYLIANQMIHVDFWGMVNSVLLIVILPVALGLTVRNFFEKHVELVIPYLPPFSLFMIALIIAIIIGLNQKDILEFKVLIVLAVIMHNTLGFALGYFIGHLFKLDDKDSRAMAFEIGMQNSGLGTALAVQFLNAHSALPAAIFSLWQNIAGSFLAKFWADKDQKSQ